MSIQVWQLHLRFKNYKFPVRIFVSIFVYICSTFSHSETISNRCVSSSGMSTYEVSFDTYQDKGEIRYKYMGQDIIYEVFILEKNKNKIIGKAFFKKSYTGEVRGSSFNFTYDRNSRTFEENGLKASCK